MKTLSKDNTKKLQMARPAIKFDRYSDELTQEERQQMTEDEKTKSEVSYA